jgi:hypothetical protein
MSGSVLTSKQWMLGFSTTRASAPRSRCNPADVPQGYAGSRRIELHACMVRLRAFQRPSDEIACLGLEVGTLVGDSNDIEAVQHHSTQIIAVYCIYPRKGYEKNFCLDSQFSST